MSKTVWKFVLPGHDRFTIEMPKGAEIIHVEAQGNDGCVWAIVDPQAKREQRPFVLAGTGHPLPDVPLRHLGSFLLFGGSFVGHLFEPITGKK